MFLQVFRVCFQILVHRFLHDFFLENPSSMILKDFSRIFSINSFTFFRNFTKDKPGRFSPKLLKKFLLGFARIFPHRFIKKYFYRSFTEDFFSMKKTSTRMRSFAEVYSYLFIVINWKFIISNLCNSRSSNNARFKLMNKGKVRLSDLRVSCFLNLRDFFSNYR